jgi:hypothetical protein
LRQGEKVDISKTPKQSEWYVEMQKNVIKKKKQRDTKDFSESNLQILHSTNKIKSSELKSNGNKSKEMKNNDWKSIKSTSATEGTSTRKEALEKQLEAENESKWRSKSEPSTPITNKTTFKRRSLSPTLCGPPLMQLLVEDDE